MALRSSYHTTIPGRPWLQLSRPSSSYPTPTTSNVRRPAAFHGCTCYAVPPAHINLARATDDSDFRFVGYFGLCRHRPLPRPAPRVCCTAHRSSRDSIERSAYRVLPLAALNRGQYSWTMPRASLPVRDPAESTRRPSLQALLSIRGLAHLTAILQTSWLDGTILTTAIGRVAWHRIATLTWKTRPDSFTHKKRYPHGAKY